MRVELDNKETPFGLICILIATDSAPLQLKWDTVLNCFISLLFFMLPVIQTPFFNPCTIQIASIFFCTAGTACDRGSAQGRFKGFILIGALFFGGNNKENGTFRGKSRQRGEFFAQNANVIGGAVGVFFFIPTHCIRGILAHCESSIAIKSVRGIG